MTRARKTKKAKASRWKAANKRKPMTAAKQAPTKIILEAEEPTPFPFWPFQMMRWWMPSSGADRR